MASGGRSSFRLTTSLTSKSDSSTERIESTITVAVINIEKLPLKSLSKDFVGAWYVIIALDLSSSEYGLFSPSVAIFSGGWIVEYVERERDKTKQV